MKKINYLFVNLAIIGIFTLSCGKDVTVEPTEFIGQADPIGLVGPAGPAGADGKAGSVIYSGTATPDASLGVIGDYFLNSNTGFLHGPKTAAGWDTGFSLKGNTGATGSKGETGATGPKGEIGATGSAGKPGSQILSGFGIPDASLGADGDYYLNKSNFMIYGPKITSGWGPAVSLQPAGTANVLYSGWNYAKNFRDTTMDGSNFRLADLPALALSSDYLQTAVYQVYFAFGDGIHPLPYTSYASGKQNTISYFPRLKHFMITRFTSDNSNNAQLSTLLQYRYVIISGGTKLLAGKHVDLNDYEAVRKFYRIPD